ERIGRLEPWLTCYVNRKGGLLSRMEFMGCQWVSSMERAVALHRHGGPVFAARYEELKSIPHEVLDAMFAHCGLPPADRPVLDRGLAADSQAGSSLARTTVQAGVGGNLTEADLAELERAITELSSNIKPDSVLPNTFGVS